MLQLLSTGRGSCNTRGAWRNGGRAGGRVVWTRVCCAALCLANVAKSKQPMALHTDSSAAALTFKGGLALLDVHAANHRSLVGFALAKKAETQLWLPLV